MSTARLTEFNDCLDTISESIETLWTLQLIPESETSEVVFESIELWKNQTKKTNKKTEKVTKTNKTQHHEKISVEYQICLAEMKRVTEKLKALVKDNAWRMG